MNVYPQTPEGEQGGPTQEEKEELAVAQADRLADPEAKVVKAQDGLSYALHKPAPWWQ